MARAEAHESLAPEAGRRIPSPAGIGRPEFAQVSSVQEQGLRPFCPRQFPMLFRFRNNRQKIALANPFSAK